MLQQTEATISRSPASKQPLSNSGKGGTRRDVYLVVKSYCKDNVPSCPAFPLSTCRLSGDICEPSLHCSEISVEGQRIRTGRHRPSKFVRAEITGNRLFRRNQAAQLPTSRLFGQVTRSAFQVSRSRGGRRACLTGPQHDRSISSPKVGADAVWRRHLVHSQRPCTKS
jgi:hypothetical protein